MTAQIYFHLMDSSPKNYEENCCQSEEKTRLRKGNKKLRTIVALKRGTRLADFLAHQEPLSQRR
jgi:hypothetical protein